MKRVVGEKGQVTIPKALRDSLTIGPGTELDFVEEDGKLVARRVTTADPLSALVGLLGPTNADAAITQMRGRPWNPSWTATIIATAVDSSILIDVLATIKFTERTRCKPCVPHHPSAL